VNLAAQVSLFSRLSNVDKAKLVADLEELTFQPGETILSTMEEARGWAYFMVDGEVEISVPKSGGMAPLLILGPGDVFGDTGSASVQFKETQVRAISPSRLCRVPTVKWKRLLETDSSLAQAFTELISRQLSASLRELARTRRLLDAYAEEFWDSVPAPYNVECAAADIKTVQRVGTEQSQAPRWYARDKPPSRWHQLLTKQTMLHILGTISSVLIYLLHPGPYKLAAITAILVWAGYNWFLGALPDYVIALMATVLAGVTGVVKPNVALAGFSSPAWFLLAGVLGIGVAVSKSGLLYRLALHMLQWFPPTYKGQSLAMAITGLLFTPLLPSSTSRTAMASPLALELSEAMRFPDRSNGSAGLAMSSFLGFGQMYFMAFSGGSICMLVWSLLPEPVRQQITWMNWLWISLPLGLITFIGSYLAILYRFPPEPTAGVSPHTIQAQLRVLGSMTRTERITSAVLGLVLVGFVTESWHHIDPAWVAMAGFLILIMAGVLDRDALKGLDWAVLLLVGALVSVAEITKVTGFNDQLTAWVQPLLHPFSSSPYLFLTAVAVLTIIVKLAVPINQAVLIVALSLLPVSSELGYNPFIVTLVVLALSNSWILPQQNSMYVTVFSGTEERAFTMKQVRPLALLHAGVGVIAVVASVPFWRLLGLMP
jgi:anion transporter